MKISVTARELHQLEHDDNLVTRERVLMHT
jgi:hypothetical protein